MGGMDSGGILLTAVSPGPNQAKDIESVSLEDVDLEYPTH